MAREESQKLKILYVAKILQEKTDPDHSISASEIIAYLEDYGVNAEVKSIYRDIALLRDVYGMDIEGGQGKKYKLMSREFDFEELSLLAECVYSAKFISEKSAKNLVDTIGMFASEKQAEKLSKEVFLCDRTKTTRNDVLRNVSKINQAMAYTYDGHVKEPTKIEFQYLRYDINDLKNQVERKGGKTFVVSPFKLLINEGNYYLLSYSDYAQDIRTYRVDRMKNIKILSDKREGEEQFKKINIENYTKQVFSMFGGDTKRVEMKFSLNLLDSVIERFGTGSKTLYEKDNDYFFKVSTPVAISDQFYSWICSFKRKAEIIAPEDVRKDFIKYLNEILNKYEE